MRTISSMMIIVCCLITQTTFGEDGCDTDCCRTKGGIHYCDSSAGRYVCGDGNYSSCYCTRHAVMDLQKIQGCCLWQGGVLTTDHKTGQVICNNGSVSELCSLQTPIQSTTGW